MKNRIFVFSLLLLFVFTTACENGNQVPENVLKGREMVVTNELLSTNFVGNGAQWGGYDIVPTWVNAPTMSDADWNTLYERIDFMRPPFLRLMTTANWSYMDADANYNPENDKTVSLYKMLDYAQSRNIEITFGEWGHSHIGSNIADVDADWVKNSVKYLDYLVGTKGYTCIKTVNMINEPNGDWSSAKGSFDVWIKVQKMFIEEMKNYPSLANVSLMGPDVAIFDGTRESAWITRAADSIDANIGLYDIHVYPKQQIVRNGDYTKMLQAYRDVTPANKRIVLGEIGFKYTEVDADLKARNEAAIEADPFASDDSNMMIYESFYGIDMADGIIQSMIAGFSGALVWSMDDAMYNFTGSVDNKELKRWGFWNIMGEELCGDASDEEIRPYFYPASLLCRYFPAGSNIYKINLPNKKGVRAIMGEKDGKYTIAIVNSHYSSYEINLKSDNLATLTLDKYVYKSKAGDEFVGAVNDKGFAVPAANDVEVNLTAGHGFTLEGESFVLFTNMD